ncbi:MRP-L47-domain-containing protein [Rhizopogon vinicolor AM-OR11-026]|uniref:Large ribosomal subunit protein uL29m n=1 Tax=Rhizopogon vinicolor AM-OR11-026 TaxID=1314800 RepID=A0A1B7NHR7_9AGAM|nr:MRP-L47-domain-containing protein [Rhizopogon vinicolor AM-OR11-026]
MTTILQAVRPLRAFRLLQSVRWNSNEVPLIDPSRMIQKPGYQPPTRKSRGAPLRPHLGVEVDPNHGLWAFFRKKEVDGEMKYESLEPRDTFQDDPARSWKAAELRRKSFKDLHTLWYVLLRERNLLAAQREEGRRLGVTNPESLAGSKKDHQCRKSMARIKYVINERRLLYEKYAEELEAKRQVLASQPTPTTAEVQPSQEKRRVSRAERLKARRTGRTVAPVPV